MIQEIVLRLLYPIGIAINISTEPTKIQISPSQCANPPVDYSALFKKKKKSCLRNVFSLGKYDLK